MRAGMAIGLVAAAFAASAESLEARLIRSIQVGTLQEVGVDEIRGAMKSGGGSYLAFPLAAGALKAAALGDGSREWTVARLLDKTLAELHRGLGVGSPADLPPGFGGDDLVILLVHALVLGGDTDAAIEILARHARSGSDFKRAVALQALRNIGVPAADALIQKAVEGGDDHGIPGNLLADRLHPFLHEVAARAKLIAPGERNRSALSRYAREPCGERAALAVYFLGYLAAAPRRHENDAELGLLRELAATECFHTRHFALRALALRSPETLPWWTQRYRAESDAWTRALIVRIAWARFGSAFEPHSLDWLAGETSQYVQWELAHGYLASRRGVRLRDYWDLWHPTTLQLRLSFPPSAQRDVEPDFDAVLRWLESGRGPRHPWVRNHLLYGIAKHVQGRQTRRFLALFEADPGHRENAWILAPLADPGALPLLRYWESTQAEVRSRAELTRTITRLEGAIPDRARARPCCRPTRECLLSQVDSDPGATSARIVSQEEARRWLQAGTLESVPDVRFTDRLERTALVATAAGVPEPWEHLYGCWRRVVKAAR